MNLRRIFFYIVVFQLATFGSVQSRAEEDVCKCEALGCSPCEMQTGLTFYTEKCAGGRTKSCQRPTCEPMRNPPKECAKIDAAGTPSANPSPAEVVIAPQENKDPVGLIMLVRGSAKVLTKMGDKEAKAGLDVFEKDTIETADNGVVKVVMADKNILNIAGNSRVKLRGFENSKDKGYSSSTIDLIYGKVRSQVVTKPKFPDKPTFRVRTPAAVAGVRGTDFITTHLKGGDLTKVETLKGTVELGGYGSDEKTLIRKGQFASFVVVSAKNPIAQMADDDIGNVPLKGFLTPIYTLTDLQYEKLNVETDYQPDGSDRIVAALKAESDKPVCSAPTGHYNQCAWICKNNPSGQSKCRTDINGVTCVRYRCDAGGRWSSEERLPANSSISCGPEAKVGSCDY